MVVRYLLAAALAAGLAAAQGRGGDDMGMGGSGGGMGRGGGMGEEGGMSGMPRAAQRQTKFELFADKLKLNGNQKEEAAKLLSEAAQKTAPIRQQIDQGRQAIATMLMQKKTEEEMKPIMEAYTKVCAQMTGAETDAFAKIYAGLKPNQQKNAAQAFEIMAGIFMPQQLGGGRGMGRGMGGGMGEGMGGGRGRGGRN